MISSREKEWHYPEVIVKRNSIKRYCLICFHSFRTKSKFELHKSLLKTIILEFNQYQIPAKAFFIIYADFDYII